MRTCEVGIFLRPHVQLTMLQDAQRSALLPFDLCFESLSEALKFKFKVTHHIIQLLLGVCR